MPAGLQLYLIDRLVTDMGLVSVHPGEGEREVDAKESVTDEGYRTDNRYPAAAGSWHKGSSVQFVTNLAWIGEGRVGGMREYVLPRRAEMILTSAEFLTNFYFYFAEVSAGGTKVYAVANTSIPWRPYRGGDGIYRVPLRDVRWPVHSGGPNLRAEYSERTPDWWMREHDAHLPETP
jgi:hypothetical protein